MTTASSSRLPKYHYLFWPEWVRWASLPVLPAIGAALFYVVFSIVNSFGTPFPTALLAVIATGLASAVYVVVAITLAPHFRHLVGVIFASIVVILAIWLVAMKVSGEAQSSGPVWYTIVLAVAATIGSIVGGAFGFSEGLGEPLGSSRRILPRLPDVVRWIIALPIGIVLSLLVLALEVTIAYSSKMNTQIVRIENNIVLSVVFMASIVSVIPRGKTIVGVALASIWGISGILEFFGPLFRPLFNSAMEAYAHSHGYEVGYYPLWSTMLESAPSIVASLIIIIGSRQAAREQRAKHRSATP